MLCSEAYQRGPFSAPARRHERSLIRVDLGVKTFALVRETLQQVHRVFEQLPFKPVIRCQILMQNHNAPVGSLITLFGGFVTELLLRHKGGRPAAGKFEQV